MQLKQMNITDLNVRYREEHVCISILIQKDVQEYGEGPDVGDTEDMEE